MSTLTEVRSKSTKRKPRLLWLCTEMEKAAEEVNDREICRRLRQFAGQTEYDLTLLTVQELSEGRAELDTTVIPEPLLPFVRHFQYMRRRKRGA